MAEKVRCQKCHETNHSRYLKHVLGEEGGRHHGIDALTRPLICAGCHVLSVNDDQNDLASYAPHLICNTCHSNRGSFNHAPPTWGPTELKESHDRIASWIRGVQSGGDHGKTYLSEVQERGVRNVSCKSCHDPNFCTDCHSRMNTHGITEQERKSWGFGGRHSYSGVVLAQGDSLLKANQERGVNCWVCHESQQNCFDTCHSGERKTNIRFHETGWIDRHQGELDATSLRCSSCHQEKKGLPALSVGSYAIGCRECHEKAITGYERPSPPHPIGWARRRLGKKTMHGEAVCARGGPGICFQCHSQNENRPQERPPSCSSLSCHGTLKKGSYNIPLCRDP